MHKIRRPRQQKTASPVYTKREILHYEQLAHNHTVPLMMRIRGAEDAIYMYTANNDVPNVQRMKKLYEGLQSKVPEEKGVHNRELVAKGIYKDQVWRKIYGNPEEQLMEDEDLAKRNIRDNMRLLQANAKRKWHKKGRSTSNKKNVEFDLPEEVHTEKRRLRV